MQMTKTFLLACAVSVLCLPQAGSGADNEKQNRARQALEQRLRELESTPAPAPKAPTAPAPAAPPKAAPAAAAPATPAVKTTPVDPALIEKAREANRRATENYAPVPAASPQMDRARNLNQQKQTQVQFGNEFGPVPGPNDNPAVERAREQARQRQSNILGGTEFPPVPEPNQGPAVDRAVEQARSSITDGAAFATVPGPTEDPAVERARAEARRREAELARQAAAVAGSGDRDLLRAQRMGASFDPLPAPALPISAEKQGKLAELLRRYQADEITPSQYHAERKKILAAP